MIFTFVAIISGFQQAKITFICLEIQDLFSCSEDLYFIIQYKAWLFCLAFL